MQTSTNRMRGENRRDVFGKKIERRKICRIRLTFGNTLGAAAEE